VALLACSHVFHAGCLARWKDKCLKKGIAYTCAMCRRPAEAAAAAAAEEEEEEEAAAPGSN
jgi:hypothetical protein